MHVVLLHALGRTALSMYPLARALERAGHAPLAIDYPSRRAPLTSLAAMVLERVAREGLEGRDDLAFVGHSMGGVLIRALPLVSPSLRYAGAVTLGSPLNGARVAETLSALAPFRAFYGPAFSDITPKGVATLPAAAGPIGNIAGTRRSAFVPASHVLRLVGCDEPSDSTVLVREALSADATDRACVHVTHSLLPWSPEVHALVVRFLGHGRFHAA